MNSSAFTDPLYIIILIIGIIAFIFGGIIIILSLFIKNKLSYSFSLILNLLFMSSLHSLSYTFNWVYTDNGTFKACFGRAMCIIQSSTLIFSSLSEELWLTIITFTTHKLIASPKNNNSSSLSCQTLIIFLLICYFFPLAVTVFYLSLGYLGENHLNCWLLSLSRDENYYIKGLVLYLHKWINLILVIIFSLKTIKYFNSFSKNEIKEQGTQTPFLRILIFPLIQIIGTIIPTIYTILIGFNIDADFFAIPTLICGSVPGLLFPIIYLTFENVRKELFSFFKRPKEKDRTMSLGALYNISDDLNKSAELPNI